MKRRLTALIYISLEKAVATFAQKSFPAYEIRRGEKAREWLRTIAEYMAIKRIFRYMKPWTAWSDEAIKRRQPDALASTARPDEVEYHH